jgi:2,3-bisphosphoglycerate-dependent phosphoglycerate mutase
MQLYFARHAQSTNNVLWSTTGSSVGRSEDPLLTPLGRRQARALGRWLANGSPAPDPEDTFFSEDEAPPPGTHAFDFDEGDLHNRRGFGITHLYTSLMLRSVLTGEILAQALGLPLLAWPEIHETGGIFLDLPSAPGLPARQGQPGKSPAYFAHHHPALVLPEGLNPDGWWSRPFEEHAERLDRVQRFLQQLQLRHGGTHDRVLIISHGAFYGYFLRTLLGMPPQTDQDANPWFTLNNCALSRFDFTGQSTAVVYLNRADHLPAGLIT